MFEEDFEGVERYCCSELADIFRVVGDGLHRSDNARQLATCTAFALPRFGSMGQKASLLTVFRLLDLVALIVSLLIRIELRKLDNV